jgi:phage terminase large subunit-like protein
LQVKQACERTLQDLKRDDLTFDNDRIDHVCDFASNLPHVIGPLSGTNIRLEPFQIYILANLFGFLDKQTGLRKYREAFILLPRGSAKSTLASILALYMTFCEAQGGAEGYSGATSLAQANKVFEPARMMVQRTPALAEALGLEVAARSIYQVETGSRFSPVIANTKDGDIPWIAICDELHQAKNGVQLAAFRTGMGKRRGSDPLLLIISTAGTNVAGVCRQEQLYFESVLNGTLKDDSKFALIYTIDKDDDWKDFKVWRKANPAFGISVDEAHLKREYDKALQSPSAQADCLTKYLNVWCNTATGWLNMKHWTAAADPAFVIPNGSIVWLGVDLSTKTDITALCLCWIGPDGRKGFIPYLFLPAGALDRSPNAKAYADWIARGALIRTEGEASDHEVVEAKIRELCATYKVEMILYDSWQSASMMQRLAKDGLNVMEFAQRAANFSAPMIDFEAELMNGSIVHNDNPVMNWMASNASVARRGPLITITKPTGQDDLKIDGMVTALMAYAMATKEAPAASAPVELFWLD